MQNAKTVGGKSKWDHIRRNWGLYLLMLPAFVMDAYARYIGE